MTQEAAYILNIKGSSETIQSLNAVQKQIAEVAAELTALKKEGSAAEKEVKKLTTEIAKLTKQEENIKKELGEVNKRMKELLATNKQAGKEYKELKTRRQELLTLEGKVDKQLQSTTAKLQQQSAVIKRTTSDIDLLTTRKNAYRVVSNELGRDARKESQAFVDVNKAMNQQLGIIPRLEKEHRRLREEIRKQTDLTTHHSKALIRQAAEVKRNLDTANRSFGDFKSTIGDYDGALARSRAGLLRFSKEALGAFGVGSALYIGADTMRKMVSASIEFEKALDELSGITGATGTELKFLSDEALRISANFGTASAEILRVFKLLGALNPELLKNSVAMTSMAESADILANAGLVDVDTSVKGLVKVMADFDLSAEHSTYVINRLSKASQEGGAEIPQILETLGDAGQAARKAGVTFEQFVAITEGMAKKLIVGGEAGRVMRNMFIELTQLGRDDLNPMFTDWGDIMDTLALEIKDAGQAAAVFQKENAVGVLALINSRDEYRRHMELMVEYNEAQKLAAINTDNTATSIKRLTEAIKNVGVVWGPYVTEPLKIVTDELSFLLGILSGEIGLLESPEDVKKRKSSADESKKILQELISANVEGRDAVMKMNALINDTSTLNNLEKLSIKQLQQLRKFYKAMRPVNEEGQKELTATISAITDMIDKKLGRDGETEKKVIEFAVGTVGFLEEQISKLNTVLKNTTDETLITETTTQIVALEAELQKLNDLIETARNRATRKPTTVTDKLPTNTTLPTLITNSEQDVPDEIALIQVTEDLKEQILLDAQTKRLANQDAADALAIEHAQRSLDALESIFGQFGENLNELFSGNAEDRKNAQKQILLDILKFAELAIQAQLLVGQAAAGSAGPLAPVLSVKQAIFAALIKAAFAGLAALVKGYELGGVVKGGMPFKKPGSSDDTLAHVKQGEIILTKHNQATARKAYGENVFGVMGVRGFKQAPINNHISVLNKNADIAASLDKEVMYEFAEITSDAVAKAIIQQVKGNRLYDRSELVKGSKRFRK